MKLRKPTTTVSQLKCDHRENPIGIDTPHPQLSWILTSAKRGTMQTAYQIVVYRVPEVPNRKKTMVWDTKKIISSQSVGVVYHGPKLETRKRYSWQVRVWDENHTISAWSLSTFWEMGLFSDDDWKAKWIESKKNHAVVYMRRNFVLKNSVASARLYATAHGIYEVSINGKNITKNIFSPGWTSYHHRLQYQTYDVTKYLEPNENAIGVILGDGWWRGKVGTTSIQNAYGKTLGFLAQLHITFADGTSQIITTDPEWKTSSGPILLSDFKDGELYDARQEQNGWNLPMFDDTHWQFVHTKNFLRNILVAQVGLPVVSHEQIKPVSILKTPSGQTVVDMGQNFAGRIKISVKGHADDKVILQHGESLDKNGNFSLQHLSLPFNKLQQKITYICKGSKATEIFEPHFTYHGFRYVLIESFPTMPTVNNFMGIALYTDLPETGIFSCSNALLNKLHKNIVWTQKSNLVDIPTDCPQRERVGWTGDAQIYASTTAYTWDVTTFFTKWLTDLAVEQSQNGKVPNMVPNPYTKFKRNRIFPTMMEASAGWGDAAIIVPWVLYQRYADTQLLKEQYPSMKAWVTYMVHQAKKTPWYKKINIFSSKKYYEPYIWNTGFHWGEWFEPSAGKGFGIKMYITIVKNFLFGSPEVATAYLAYATTLLSHIAKNLGYRSDAKHYMSLSKKIKYAFAQEYIHENGYIGTRSQSSYVRALSFDLVPQKLQKLAAKQLEDTIINQNYHLDTGFLSTGLLLPVLADTGYATLAYKLLLQDTNPSWIYQIKKGATTVWETWDGIAEDGTVSASLNHIALGTVGKFFYEYIAGMSLDAPRRHITIKPFFDNTISHAHARYNSIYGPIAISWKRKGTTISLHIIIPPNTTASVILANATNNDITESNHSLHTALGIHAIRQVHADLKIEIGSGEYQFQYTNTKITKSINYRRTKS